MNGEREPPREAVPSHDLRFSVAHDSRQLPLTIHESPLHTTLGSSLSPLAEPSPQRNPVLPSRFSLLASRYILGTNMMCALGVPGNISQGWSCDGTLGMPVLAVVAKGMYTTYRCRAPLTSLAAAS